MAAFAKGQSVKAVVVQSDAAGRSIGSSTCVVVVLVYSYTNRGILLARGSTVLGGWGCGRASQVASVRWLRQHRGALAQQNGEDRPCHCVHIVRDSVFARCAGEDPAAIINAWGTQPVRVGSSFFR